MPDTIWKHAFNIEDEFELQLPADSKFLAFGVQAGTPVMWFQVTGFPDPNFETRKFRIVGTGHPFDPSGLNYLGTFMLVNDTFVGHLFEETNA